MRSGVGVGEELAGALFELIGEGDIDAGAGAGEVEDAVVGGVAVLAEEQALGHELDAFGLPGSFGVVGHPATFGLDRNGFVADAGDEVELGGEPEGGGGEGDGAGDGGRLVAPRKFPWVVGFIRFRSGLGQNMVELIDASVDVPAFGGVVVVFPSALDVHEVEQPGAIGELVEHAQGQRVGGEVGVAVFGRRDRAAGQ